jgi:hypothetical protein
MASYTPTHYYRGEIIMPCRYAPGRHAGPWRLYARHSASGLPWDDPECQHFATLADAKLYIEGLR